MNEKVKEAKFGLVGSKKLDGGFIDLHISVGEIWDISTNKRYAIALKPNTASNSHPSSPS